tara:strand:+ start:2262 stop:2765 length:504 start_codon:yes stop_codon:yes gene_type:complete
MIFRNQALLTFAIALGLVTAGAYVEKNATPFSASVYVADAGSYGSINRAYYEVREVESDVVPAPVESAPTTPLLEEDALCPVEYNRPYAQQQTQPRVINNGTCRPVYRNNCSGYYYQRPLARGTYAHWNYRPCQPARNVVRFFHNRRPVRRGVGIVARGVGRLFCWR